MSAQKLVGVDGCRGGWIAATRQGVRLVERVAELFRGSDAPAVVAIDIPIGLADRGARRCDEEARRRLPGRASSVFRPPIRPMLVARSQSEASAIGRSLDRKGVSAQCWAIADKIREVDELVRDEPPARRALHEVHPELAFALMNGGALAERKRTAAGGAQRRALLEAPFGALVREASPRDLGCRPDDVLDAFAALWSAERIARGEAVTLPADPPRDAHGIAMSISA